jgi:hypothetical protein
MANAGYFLERFVHTRMPFGSTPWGAEGVSSGSATTVLGAVLESPATAAAALSFTGVVRVLISCLSLGKNLVDGMDLACCPARNVTVGLFEQHRYVPFRGAYLQPAVYRFTNRNF